jgi:hypothetical protein
MSQRGLHGATTFVIVRMKDLHCITKKQKTRYNRMSVASYIMEELGEFEK